MAMAMAVAAVLAVPAPARAEYWLERAGELLGHATEVSVVELKAGGGGGVGMEGVVVKSYRGRPVGASVPVAVPFTQLELGGQRVLFICDRSMCPRALGVDHGGFWLLEAYAYGDGAAVLPGLLDDAIVTAAQEGKPPKPLCLRAMVQLTDEVAASTLTGSFSPLDGTGTVTGPAVSGASLPAQLQFGAALGRGAGALARGGERRSHRPEAREPGRRAVAAERGR